VPFWIVNLVAAFVGMPLRTFVLGTGIGIIPGTAIFASVGSGLGVLLDQGHAPDFTILLSPSIFLPLLSLGLLSLIPIAVRHFRRSRGV
jgi:uncharacterized membrane protein YdjX (TVP38/TMEM64 family)